MSNPKRLTHRLRAMAVLAASVTVLIGAAPLAASATAASLPTEAISTAEPIVLVPSASDWRWRYSNEAWEPGWRGSTFDDSFWGKAAAPLGWGRGVTSTIGATLSVGERKPLAIRVRKSFTVDDPTALSNVVLSVRVDDGTAVFINGREVGRANLPSGTVTASTYATKAPNSAIASQLVRIGVPATALRAGNNIISASVHLNWRASPSVSFDASLTATDNAPSAPVAPEPEQPVEPEPPVAEEPPAEPEPPVSEVCGAQGPLAPECGALWGAYTTRGSNLTTAVTDLESRVGRQFDITLRYHDFSTHQHQGLFPDSHQQTLGIDRTLLFAWQARVNSTSTDIQWKTIAAGQWDKYIDDAATRIKAYGQPVMVAFDPEFDNQKLKGTMAEYVSAYRRIHDKFRSAGVTNVTWLWVSTGYLGAGNDAKILAGYPGDDYVDWVGFDPYNFFTCNGSGWNTFEQEIAPVYDFFLRNGMGSKPQILGEYGTEFDDANPARSTQWYKDIPSVLKRYPNIKALVRFDANSISASCNVSIDNGPGMFEAFKAAGLDPYLNVRD